MAEPKVKSPQQGGAAPAKKRYEKPTLEAMGTFTELTQAAGNMSTVSDGPMTGSTKTR